MARALRQESIGNVMDLDRRRAMLGYDSLQEIDHQFQVAIEGIATPNLTFMEFDLPFDVEFFFTPQQRDSPLVVPQFTFGAQVIGDATPADANNPSGCVGVTACIVGWASDPTRNAITGARVAIGVWCGGPGGVSQQIDFNGFVHLTFQGFGAPGGADGGDNNPAANVGA